MTSNHTNYDSLSKPCTTRQTLLLLLLARHRSKSLSGVGVWVFLVAPSTVVPWFSHFTVTAYVQLLTGGSIKPISPPLTAAVPKAERNYSSHGRMFQNFHLTPKHLQLSHLMNKEFLYIFQVLLHFPSTTLPRFCLHLHDRLALTSCRNPDSTITTTH